MEDILVQRITLKRQGAVVSDLDLGYMTEITVVETIDLSGPRLMLSMRDPFRVLRDQWRPTSGDTLEIFLSDRFGDDEIDNIMEFTIMTKPVDGDVIKFSGFETSVNTLKTPAAKAMLFQKKPIKTVLRKLAQHITDQDIGQFPEASWHLLPGMRKTKLLRQMSIENGAACFWRRKKLIFKSFKDLFAAEPAFTYEHSNPKAQYVIPMFTIPGKEAIVSDRTDRLYVGWDMINGVVKGAKGTTSPEEFIGHSTPAALDAHRIIPVPAIDFTVSGNGGLMPGITLGLKFNVDNRDAPLDESIPGKILITTVAHHYSGQKYACRVQGAVIP